MSVCGTFNQPRESCFSFTWPFEFCDEANGPTVIYRYMMPNN